MIKRLLGTLAIMAFATAAHSVPVLQIYIDGSTYDTDTQTWTTSEAEFDLWVIGNVEAHGTIQSVQLTATFYGLDGSMTLTPVATTRIADPSTPTAPLLSTSSSGNHIVLPSHGIFTDPTVDHWTDFSIGSMPLTDSPIADFNGSDSFPTGFPNSGQINVYHVTVDGWTKVHFDAYGETINSANGKKSFWKTPFSHDGMVPVQGRQWGAIKELYQ